MELGEVGHRVYIRERLGIKPLRELLQHHEVVRGVVELVPNHMAPAFGHCAQVVPTRASTS